MAEGDLKLLGAWTSPFAMRVRMVLEQKGLNYEYLEEDLKNKSELLLKHNPIHKQVPVLIHGDCSICESLVILQYIDETWPGTGPPVLPADPYERAVARFWASYVDEKMRITVISIMKAASEETKAEKIAETLAGLELLEGAFKKCSAGKTFFGGDTIGYLDATFGSCLAWIRITEKISGAKLLDEANVPLLVEWEKHFLAEDCVKRVFPSVEKLEEYARLLQATRWNVTSAK